MFFSKLTLTVLLGTTVAGLASASTLDDIVGAPVLAYRAPQRNGGNRNNNKNNNNKAGQGKAVAATQAATPASSSAAAPAAPAAPVAAAAAGAGGAGVAAASLTLKADAIQTGSAFNGQEAGTDPGQVASATDNANFINFCSGKVLTNGLQIKTGSCNGIPMGKIPATTNMIAGIILFPQNNQDVVPNKTFNISVQINHLNAGSFTNPKNTYYAAPQELDANGDIIGHTHITVQNMGDSLNPTTPPDPQTFAFFKGVNDAGNGKGLLQAVVTGGLPAGNYRVCTMTAARNHQPVAMPVAQRGSQDDCTKFTVGKGGAAAGNTGVVAANAGGAATGGAATGTGAAAGAGTGVKAQDAGTGAGAGKGAGAGAATPAAPAPTPTTVATGAGKNTAAGTGGAAGTNKATTGAAAAGGAVDLGSCTDPTIKFGTGFDGRVEGSFVPNNKAEFPHGSTQDIGSITSFICQHVKDVCRAPQATQAKCSAAQTASQGLTGQAAADAFNKAFPAKAKRDVVQKRGRFAERVFRA